MIGGMIDVYKNVRRISDVKFIVIDSKERSLYRPRKVYFKTTCQFICTLYGAKREEIARDWLQPSAEDGKEGLGFIGIKRKNFCGGQKGCQ